jgi:hypothetical protein
MIQPGDIIAFTHEGWNSWNDIQSQIVRIFTRSEYSHVGLAWPIAGRVMIIEAVVPMIRIFPLSKLLPFYWLPLGSPLTPEAEEFALSRVGEEYSKLEAIRGFLGKTRENEKWQCAEYVKSVLRVTGCNYPGKDTPSALVFDAINNGSTLTLVTK